MPEGLRPNPRQSSARTTPFINSFRPRVPSAVLALGVLCPDTSEEKPAGKNEKLQLGSRR